MNTTLRALAALREPSSFFDNLDSFAEAPEGVAKLRELVLDLAVRGKLVEQDENDEPASELLERISDRREKLIKEKKTRRVKSEPIDIVPFDPPVGWEWTRLSDATLKITDGTHHSPTNTESGDYKYITAKNIKTDGIQLSNATYVPKEVHDEIYERCDPELDDILYIKDGATTGIVTINNLDEPFSMLSSVALLKRSEEIEPRFLLYVLRSPYFYDLMRADMSGVAITRVTLAKLNKALIPVAPLSEQRRIVSKVDDLMSLCDEFQSRGSERVRLRERASRSCLTALVNAERTGGRKTGGRGSRRAETGITRSTTSSSAGASPSQDSLSSAWQRLSDHFEVLYDTPETLAHLRQSILQLAVQGKLVPQDPNDEPASDLIETTRARKATLIRDKKIKKPKPVVPISDDDLLPLPTSWQWIRMGELIESMTNGLYKHSSFYTDDGIACVRMYNIQDGGLDLSRVQRLNLADDEIQQYQLEKNDLIVNRVNSRELVGKAAVIDGLDEPFVFEAMNIRVRFLEKDGVPDYANLLFRTDGIRELFQTDAKQASGQASISQPQVANIAVPLPPLAEQKRIVAKVDQLLSQCDELSARLRERQSATHGLLTASIHQLLDTA